MPFPPHESQLLSQVPLAARSVVDIGCGTGDLAAVYRSMNPKVHWFGLAFDPVTAERAARHVHQVATADRRSGPLPFDTPSGIDCIIYNETLEQLDDPWQALGSHAEALSEDGMMLICVRNGDHWRLADRILRGLGDAGDAAGQLPHRINRRSMREVVAAAGLTLCDMTMREPDPDGAARFATSLAPGLEALGIDPREYAKRCVGSHLLWRVRRNPFQRMLIAANMLEPVGGVSHVRVVHPIRAMATDPTVFASVTDRVEVGAAPDGTPRIFVLHRPALFGEQGHGLLRALAEAGFLIVTEFDDLPDRFEMMRQGGELSFQGAHAIQTTTAALADVLRQHNPEIAVFPNTMAVLPEVRNFASPGTMTVFFGALNRERDWLPCMPVLNAVAALAGERLRFKVIHDRGFFDALDTPHKTFTPTCDYPTYLRTLGESEISLMPLSDTPFNRAKSDLKFIEAGACRVAALASNVVYANSVEDGRTGLLFRDPAALHARLLHLVAMPELAQEIGDSARRYVMEKRMLADQVAPRIAWYRSLWDRRESLEDARRERLLRFVAAA